MATTTVPTAELLGSLTEAINSATTAFPSDEQTIGPPEDGISLLDVKNDLLLSYLQNLVFLIILRLRKSRDNEPDNQIDQECVKKLIELRVYVERGVRPLEGRLRYQIDKVLRAAEDAERTATNRNGASIKSKKQKVKKSGVQGSDYSNTDSEDEEDEDSQDKEVDDEEAQELMFRPNVASLLQKSKPATSSTSRSSKPTSTGLYKPPRITATAMPTAPSTRDARDQDFTASARRRKSNLLNEYVDEELSSAPRALPSIGSNNTILDRGRSGFSARDRERERERTEYEERNFTRLAPESKSERRKNRGKGDRDRRDVFGGEDWTGLGGLGDRINRSVGGGGGKAGRDGVLQRREKRGRDTIDGPRGDGVGIGEAFEKRRKVMDGRAQRKKGGR